MIRSASLLLITALILGLSPGTLMAQDGAPGESNTLSAPQDPFTYTPYDPSAVSAEDRAAQENQQYLLDEGNVVVTPPKTVPEIGRLNIGSLQTDTEPLVPPEEIPEILLMEMDEIVGNCRANFTYNNFHDCECLGAKFIDARLKSDPETSKESVLTQVANACPSEERIAGFVFNGCMSFMKSVRPDDYKEYCECTANTVALNYIERPIMNVGYIDNLRRDAYYSCGMRARDRLAAQLEEGMDQ